VILALSARFSGKVFACAWAAWNWCPASSKKTDMQSRTQRDFIWQLIWFDPSNELQKTKAVLLRNRINFDLLTIIPAEHPSEKQQTREKSTMKHESRSE
jgi:hypothetical protein